MPLLAQSPLGAADCSSTASLNASAAVAPNVSTYIVAQNPEVLMQLMRENESRGLNPAVYTTPASAFNTLAVDFKEKGPSNSPSTCSLTQSPHLSSSRRTLDCVSPSTSLGAVSDGASSPIMRKSLPRNKSKQVTAPMMSSTSSLKDDSDDASTCSQLSMTLSTHSSTALDQTPTQGPVRGMTIACTFGNTLRLEFLLHYFSDFASEIFLSFDVFVRVFVFACPRLLHSSYFYTIFGNLSFSQSFV